MSNENEAPQTPEDVIQTETIGEQLDFGLSDIPEEKIEEWKQNYGTVFRVPFIGESFVYRNFTYNEYKNLRNEVRKEFAEDPVMGDEVFKERIQKLCVLWPENYVERLETEKPKPIPGGIPFLLGDYILAASGFADSLVPDIISDQQ